VTATAPFLARHHFLLRRLHSLSGVVPIGVFLIFHLITNASIVWGRMANRGPGEHAGVSAFQHEVDFIHSLPALLLVEIFGLWLPIAFHSILGVYYATKGRANLANYPYQDNWRYSLQRLSGYIGLVFIFYHVATLRWGVNLPFSNVFIAERAASTTATALRGGDDNLWDLGGAIVSLLYGLGVSIVTGMLQQTFTFYTMDRLKLDEATTIVYASNGLMVGALALLAVPDLLFAPERFKRLPKVIDTAK